MRLDPNEIQPGVVVWMDQQMLMDDPDVRETLPQRYGRVRPFVCVDVAGEESTWTPLTGMHRDERLYIERRWRSGGEPPWRQGDTYLNDGANTYTGPASSFVAASHAERTTPGNRARISEDGVDEVRSEMERQRHRQNGTGAA